MDNFARFLLVCCFFSSCVLSMMNERNLDRERLKRRIDDLREQNFVFMESDFCEVLERVVCVVVQDDVGNKLTISDEQKSVLLESKKISYGFVEYSLVDRVMTIEVSNLEHFSILFTYMTLFHFRKKQGYSYPAIIQELSECDFADESFTQILELADDFMIDIVLSGLIQRYIEYGDLLASDIPRLPAHILRELRVRHFLTKRVWFDGEEESFFASDLICCQVIPSLQEFGSDNFVQLRDEDVVFEYARHEDCGAFYHTLPEGKFKSCLRTKIIEVSCERSYEDDFFAWVMRFGDRGLIKEIIENVEGEAARFVASVRFKESFASLSEGIFKVLVRKQFYLAHDNFVDGFDVATFFDRLKKACEPERRGIVNLSLCGFVTLDQVWDYLLYFNVCICPIIMLHLNNNKLRRLPDNIDALTELTSLSVHDNILQELPESMCSLRQLKVLMLQNNQLTALPDGIEKLQQLERLYISQNKITQLPPGLAELRGLHSLYMKENCIQGLCNGFFDKMQNLKFLVLDYHLVVSVPSAVRGRLLSMDRELPW